MMNKRKFINRRDFFIIFFIVIFAIIFYFSYMYFNNNNSAKAEILIEGKVIKTISLSTDANFSLPERPNVFFQVQDGKIAFTSSDCPDKICVHAGFISHSGESAACLPNKISIRIVPSNNDDIDAIAN